MSAQTIANDPLVLQWRVRSLVAENESLRAKIAALEIDLQKASGLFAETIIPSLRVQAKQRSILAFLLRRSPNFVTKSQLLLACWSDPDSVGCAVIEVHMSRLRTALRPFNVDIESSRFQGYRLSAENAARIRELMERDNGRLD